MRRESVALALTVLFFCFRNQPFIVRIGPDSSNSPQNLDIAPVNCSCVVVKSKRPKLKAIRPGRGLRMPHPVPPGSFKPAVFPTGIPGPPGVLDVSVPGVVPHVPNAMPNNNPVIGGKVAAFPSPLPLDQTITSDPAPVSSSQGQKSCA